MGPFRRRKPADPEPPGPGDEEILEHAVETIWAGFIDRDDAVTSVADYFEVEEDRVRRLVQRAWDERAAELAGGGSTDSYASLRSAFDALESDGIIALMDFTCCQTCGHAEIADEPGADTARGYAFFHQQDSERLPGGEVYLAYGAFRTSTPTSGRVPRPTRTARSDAQRVRRSGTSPSHRSARRSQQPSAAPGSP